jgi:hypothetical protein
MKAQCRIYFVVINITLLFAGEGRATQRCGDWFRKLVSREISQENTKGPQGKGTFCVPHYVNSPEALAVCMQGRLQKKSFYRARKASPDDHGQKLDSSRKSSWDFRSSSLNGSEKPCKKSVSLLLDRSQAPVEGGEEEYEPPRSAPMNIDGSQGEGMEHYKFIATRQNLKKALFPGRIKGQNSQLVRLSPEEPFFPCEE